MRMAGGSRSRTKTFEFEMEAEIGQLAFEGRSTRTSYFYGSRIEYRCSIRSITEKEKQVLPVCYAI